MTDTAKQSQQAVTKNGSDGKQTAQTKLKGQDLLKAVKKQIEFYLSRSNLQNDAYLVQQMDASLNVPVNVIAGFPKIASLTKDLKVVIKAIKSSNEVKLSADETMVKPDITLERNTIILRDLSSDIPKDDVVALFEEYNAKVSNVRSDINDVWFVQMESEDEARTVLLKMMGKQFKGKPIRGGLKTESLLRSVTPKAGASPKNVLSESNSGNPTSTSSRGGVNNMYQPPPQNIGIPQMFPPMQNGMPPMYGYMNGMPQMPPGPYMNGGMGYQPYMNAPHMYNPRFMQGQQQGHGQQNNQKGGKQSRGQRGQGNQGGFVQGNYQQANGYGRNSRNNQMHMNRGQRNNRNFRGNNNYYGNQQQNNGAGNNFNNANNQNNSNISHSSSNSNQHNNKNNKVDNSPGGRGGKVGNNANSGSNIGNADGQSSSNNNNSNSRKSKRNRNKGDNKNSDNHNSGNSKNQKDKNKKDSKDSNSKQRRNSKSRKDNNANINVNSASDFPSLGGTSKPMSTKWGTGDSSAVKRALEQEVSDDKKEAFARLKTNVNEGTAKKVVTKVIDNAVAQSNSKKPASTSATEGNSSKAIANSGVNAQQVSNASTESKQPAAENKVFSWAATVAKTANVPVKPVSKLVSKNVDGEKKKKKGDGKKAEASGKQAGKQGAKPVAPAAPAAGKVGNVSKQVGRSAPQAVDENGKVATNEGGNKVTATKTTMPIPRRGWERPELTQEREKFLKEKAQRESMADPAKVDSQQKDIKKGRRKGSDSDRGGSIKQPSNNEDKGKDSNDSMVTADNVIDMAPKVSTNATTVDNRQQDRSVSNNSKPTFAEMLRKKQQGQTHDKSNPSAGTNKNVKNSRASAFAKATGAQSSFTAEKPEREFVRSDLQ